MSFFHQIGLTADSSKDISNILSNILRDGGLYGCMPNGMTRDEDSDTSLRRDQHVFFSYAKAYEPQNSTVTFEFDDDEVFAIPDIVGDVDWLELSYINFGASTDVSSIREWLQSSEMPCTEFVEVYRKAVNRAAEKEKGEKDPGYPLNEILKNLTISDFRDFPEKFQTVLESYKPGTEYHMALNHLEFHAPGPILFTDLPIRHIHVSGNRCQELMNTVTPILTSYGYDGLLVKTPSQDKELLEAGIRNLRSIIGF